MFLFPHRKCRSGGGADVKTLDADKTCRMEMESVPPDVPYTVVDLVGKGSFGSVFKGY